MKFAIKWDKDNRFVFERVFPEKESNKKYFTAKLNYKTILSKESLFSPAPRNEDDPAYIFIDFCGWTKDILGDNHPLTEDLYLLNSDYENDNTDEEIVRMYIIMLINRMVRVL